VSDQVSFQHLSAYYEMGTSHKSPSESFHLVWLWYICMDKKTSTEGI